MLSHIYLHNFAIIDTLDLELSKGMTALTGETGAGKSILIDAIGLVLGDRADSGVVRHGADKAEITLTVDIEDTPAAKEWLDKQDLAAEKDSDDEQLCILRRVITAQGKSRVWINGTPCNLKLLRELGEQLVDIHGQHEHQSLMKKDLQRKMLDDYAENTKLLDATASCFNQWKLLHDRLESLQNQNSDHQARLDLLRFQIQELDELNLTENEADELDEEYTRLANAGALLESASIGVRQLYDNDEESVYASISEILKTLEASVVLDNNLREPFEILQNSQIQIQEATDLLRRYQESVELDPERLNWLNQRLSSLHDLARKHQTTPQDLYTKWHSLKTQLDQLASDEFDVDVLQEKLQASEKDYLAAAKKLTNARKKASQKLSKGVTEAMQTLGMEGGQFVIKIAENNKLASHGMDSIDFQVSTNPGQPLKLLQKVASGGELSRISLAIQMIAAQRVTLPALIFDEVDSGIGGGIAEVVGQQLRQLGNTRQVLCVTHLPQVASQAHNHFKVTKTKGADSTSTGMLVLDKKQRVEELARMMGGLEITQSTLNLAKEMLAE